MEDTNARDQQQRGARMGALQDVSIRLRQAMDTLRSLSFLPSRQTLGMLIYMLFMVVMSVHNLDGFELAAVAVQDSFKSAGFILTGDGSRLVMDVEQGGRTEETILHDPHAVPTLMNILDAPVDIDIQTEIQRYNTTPQQQQQPPQQQQQQQEQQHQQQQQHRQQHSHLQQQPPPYQQQPPPPWQQQHHVFQSPGTQQFGPGGGVDMQWLNNQFVNVTPQGSAGFGTAVHQQHARQPPPPGFYDQRQQQPPYVGGMQSAGAAGLSHAALHQQGGPMQRPMGDGHPTPAELMHHPSINDAARAMLADPYAAHHVEMHGPSATGTPLDFRMPLADSHNSIQEDTRITLSGNSLMVQKPRTPTSSEWLAWMLQMLARVQEVEHGLDHNPTREVLAFVRITTSKVLQQYIVWIFRLLQTNKWERMFAFDKRLRDRMVREQSGTYDPALLAHEFLTQEMSSTEGTIGNRVYTDSDDPDRKRKRHLPKPCWKFNSNNGCVAENCMFAHKCGKCSSKQHNSKDCPKK